MQRYSTDCHPISRLMRYVESLRGKADTIIRAQSGVEKFTKQLEPVVKIQPSEISQYVIDMARGGSSVDTIIKKTGITRDRTYCILGVAGVDFSQMGKVYPQKQSPSKEIGYKVQKMISEGYAAASTSKYLKISTRCAMLSLAMVGGAK